MKFIKMFFLSVVVLIVCLVVVGLLLPASWQVERSVVVNAPANSIYPFIANFKAGWPKWCEFDTEDPNITYTYSGPAEGVGAKRQWVSKKMGDGEQTITKADVATGVAFTLQMEQNHFLLFGEIALDPVGSGTKVTWRDTGTVGLNPVHRYMVYFFDKIMGPTFERSLIRLKSRVESTRSN